VQPLLEASDGRTEIAPGIAQLLGAENEHHDDKYDQPVPDTETAHCLATPRVDCTKHSASWLHEGLATNCADRRDARKDAAPPERASPRAGPYCDAESERRGPASRLARPDEDQRAEYSSRRSRTSTISPGGMPTRPSKMARGVVLRPYTAWLAR